MRLVEDLYYKYKQDVFNYLMSLTHDRSLSEDLLSETFYRALISIPTFKGKSSVKTWLFGISRNLWLQSLRKKRNHLSYEDYMGIYVSDTSSDRLITNELAQKIKALLEMKDQRTQQIIGMRIKGISYHEVSQSLDVSESSARVIDFRTKKWLKLNLKKEGLL